MWLNMLGLSLTKTLVFHAYLFAELNFKLQAVIRCDQN